MAETVHRPRRRRLALALGAAALIALLTLGGLYLTRGEGPRGARAAAPPSAPTATGASIEPAPSSSPASSPSMSHSPAPSSTARHDAVPAAAPTAFSYRGHGYTVRATVCGMNYVRPLDPPGEQHHTVCWVQQDFGFAPGTDGRGTTYVLGHSWAEDPHEVLNAVSERAMRQVLAARSRPGHAAHRLDGVPVYPVTVLNGDVITLRTANGTLHYTVRDAYAVAKDRAGDISSLMAEHTARRLVLITCAERNHVDYDYNVIVEAYLTSSTSSTDSTA